jgi:RNA polymerase sigma-70 factor (ECF subfamily)
MTSQKREEYIRELVISIQSGEKESFGELYSLFLNDVYKFVYFKVPEEEVEDLTETVFLKVWEKIHTFKEQGVAFRAWLLRIAQNTVIDYYRTKKETVDLEEIVELSDHNASPVKDLEETFEKERLRKAMEQLPENYREMLTLKFINDLSNEEIEAITKKPQSAIRVLQFRALKKLKDILAPEHP